jgi:hypothetical protein
MVLVYFAIRGLGPFIFVDMCILVIIYQWSEIKTNINLSKSNCYMHVNKESRINGRVRFLRDVLKVVQLVFSIKVTSQANSLSLGMFPGPGILFILLIFHAILGDF